MLPQHSRGFSLTEIVVAMTIILILIPAIMPIYASFMGDIEDEALSLRLSEFRRCLRIFYLENGRYPNALFDRYGNNVDILRDEGSELVNGIHSNFGTYPPNRRTYLANTPVDPYTHLANWDLIPVDNDGDGIFDEDPPEITTSTVRVLSTGRGITSGAINIVRFSSYDNDGDGRFDEDPIDVADVKSRHPGREHF